MVTTRSPPRTVGSPPSTSGRQAALPVVGGIQSDLSRANILGTLVSADRHAVAICNSTALNLLSLGSARCTPAIEATAP